MVILHVMTADLFACLEEQHAIIRKWHGIYRPYVDGEHLLFFRHPNDCKGAYQELKRLCPTVRYWEGENGAEIKK